jgi:hypothetical protein
MQPPCVAFPLQPGLIEQATCHASLIETRIPDVSLAEAVFMLSAEDIVNVIGKTPRERYAQIVAL